MGARPRVKRYMGYQAVVTAAPGHLLLGGVRETRSTAFETRDMAQRFADQSVAVNLEAGRRATGRVVLAATRTPPISRREVGENPRRARGRRRNPQGPHVRSWGAWAIRPDAITIEEGAINTVVHVGRNLLGKKASLGHQFRAYRSVDQAIRAVRAMRKRLGYPDVYLWPAKGPQAGYEVKMFEFNGRRRGNPSGPRIVYNRLLGGWYVVTGPHQTPIGGRYDSKEAAQAALYGRRNGRARRRRGRNPEPSTARFRALIRYASELRPRSWGTYAAQYGDWLMGKGPLPRRPEGMDSATSDRICTAVARIYDVRDNNPRGAAAPRGGRTTLIYPDGRLVGTWYGRHRNGGLYKHRFEHQHASIHGLPDGSIIVKARHGRLWKNFER